MQSHKPKLRVLARHIHATIVLGTALLSGLAALVSSDVRHTIRDAAEWLYPLGAIVLLTAIVGVLALALVRSAKANATIHVRAHDGRHAAKDAATFGALTEILPRYDVECWRGVDFGGIWPSSLVSNVQSLLSRHNAVEHQFLDGELETLRRVLMDAADELTQACSQWCEPHWNRHDHYVLADKQWMRNNPPWGKRFERFESRRAELGTRADCLVSSYDAIVGAARVRLPGV
jgi:hypothetical protein